MFPFIDQTQASLQVYHNISVCAVILPSGGKQIVDRNKSNQYEQVITSGASVI